MERKLQWVVRRFDELDTTTLYELLRLRSEVFVLEQKSIFLDLDNKDQACVHLLGLRDGELLAYSRIVPPGLSYEYPSIGRVVVSHNGRGMSLGQELMSVSISVLEDLYGLSSIRIGAQLYLKKFYGSFGFEQTSGIYDEDGIDHIEMTRNC